MNSIPQIAKHVADATSYGAIVATWFGYLPIAASILSIIWISIQIWESQTFNKFKAKFRKKK